MFSRRAVVLAAALIAALPAAPAQSSPPRAVDFQQSLPAMPRVAPGHGSRAHGTSGEGAVTHRSAAIEAPRRFALAGLAHETRPVELRARLSGGAWSPWVESSNGDPAWFGEGDEIQLRTRGWRPHGTIFYVDVSGVTPSGVSARGTTDGSASGPAKPRIVSRAAWGADQGQRRGCRPRVRPAYGQVRAATIHHTVSAVDYKAAEAPGMILAICRFHRDGQGWDDIGYNTLVDRFGNIYAGRRGGLDKAVLGAHAQGFNGQTTGVAVLGTHTDLEVSKRALRGLTRLLAWKLSVHGLVADDKARLVSAGGASSRYPAGRKITTKRIIAHRRIGKTECPGTALKRQIDVLLRRAQRRIDAATGGSSGGSGGVGRH